MEGKSDSNRPDSVLSTWEVRRSSQCLTGQRTSHVTLGFATLDLTLGAVKPIFQGELRSLTCDRAGGEIRFKQTWQRVEHLGERFTDRLTYLVTVFDRTTHFTLEFTTLDLALGAAKVPTCQEN